MYLKKFILKGKFFLSHINKMENINENNIETDNIETDNIETDNIEPDVNPEKPKRSFAKYYKSEAVKRAKAKYYQKMKQDETYMQNMRDRAKQIIINIKQTRKLKRIFQILLSNKKFKFFLIKNNLNFFISLSINFLKF